MAVTDHDTTAAVAEVQALARERGIDAISGIEITAVDDGRDVHVLGYFIDPDDAALAAFLATPARARASRASRPSAQRLAALGVPIDVAAAARRGAAADRPLDRPAAGRARDGRRRARRRHPRGVRPLARARTARRSCRATGPLRRGDRDHSRRRRHRLARASRARRVIDERIRALRDAGLDALEAFHPDHDAALGRALRARSPRDLGLLVTGGSDFHGDPAHGSSPGAVTLPAAEWERLRGAGTRHASR